MRRDLMDILACPVCKGTLTLTVTREDGLEVLDGAGGAAERAVDYPISEGIPNLLPPEMRRAMEAETASH